MHCCHALFYCQSHIYLTSNREQGSHIHKKLTDQAIERVIFKHSIHKIANGAIELTDTIEVSEKWMLNHLLSKMRKLKSREGTLLHC